MPLSSRSNCLALLIAATQSGEIAMLRDQAAMVNRQLIPLDDHVCPCLLQQGQEIGRIRASGPLLKIAPGAQRGPVFGHSVSPTARPVVDSCIVLCFNYNYFRASSVIAHCLTQSVPQNAY